jgi:hypothetical protein
MIIPRSARYFPLSADEAASFCPPAHITNGHVKIRNMIIDSLFMVFLLSQMIG